MNRPIAILVEDDRQQLVVSQRLLEEARFDVRVFDSIAPTLNYIQNSDELVDLCVLDRRLPVVWGDPASDELGDELLREVRVKFPDSRLIVFTGNTDVPHLQRTHQGARPLPAQDEAAIDCITVLEKHQSLEFKQAIAGFRRLLQSLENIQIETPEGVSSLDGFDQRLLRRFAFAYRATSISAVSLGGGLTEASVWMCTLSCDDGHLARVVAKCVSKRAPLGGLPVLLPRSTTTATVATLDGLIAGKFISVLQVVGESPYSLMSQISRDAAQAVELARPLWNALRDVECQKRSLSLKSICASLIDWDQIAVVVERFGIDVPSGDLVATTCIGLRHGDLHPGNILIDDGNAVLIDFDSTTFASGLLDPVTMLVSTLVHPDSTIAGSSWPGVDDISLKFGTAEFGLGHEAEPWFRGVNEWVAECRTSDREFWSLVLAYAARQIEYPDVLSDIETIDRVVAVVQRAASKLHDT